MTNTITINRKNKSICSLLFRREMGYFYNTDEIELYRLGAIEADHALVLRHSISDIKNITPNQRSSYVLDSSSSGLAIASHTNRCVSIINTGTMKKICDIQGNLRTVWTVAVHPYLSSLIATGSLGGHVSVFKNYVLYRSTSHYDNLTNLRIASISFHPLMENIVCYAIRNQIIIWDYENNLRLAELNTDNDYKIKYLKFNPINSMLITGIRRENVVNKYGCKLDNFMRCYNNNNNKNNNNNNNNSNGTIYDTTITQQTESSTEMLITIFHTLATILDNIEFSDSDINLPNYWKSFLQQLRDFNCMANKNKVRFTLKSTFINHIQDLRLTIYGFHNKVKSILTELSLELRMMDDVGIIKSELNHELCKLKQICQEYYNETNYINYRSDISVKDLIDIFCKIHLIMKIIQIDANIFENIRIYADISRHHLKLQGWELSLNNLPDINQDWRNTITYCYIHNDSTVDISKCGKIIVSFRELTTGRFLINAHSLEKHKFGQLLYRHKNFELTHIMSVSVSPSLEYILVGLRSECVFGYFIKLTQGNCDKILKSIQSSQSTTTTQQQLQNLCNEKYFIHFIIYDSIFCDDSVSYLKWMARPGDGAIIGYRSFHLRCISIR